MPNIQTTPITSTLLQNKLGRLVVRLQQQAGPQGNNTDFSTLEQTITEATKILSQFYQTLSEPNYQPVDQLFDTVPSADAFNNNMQAILDDLEVSFSEFENLEGVVLGQFNFMVSRLNRLNRKLKTASSSLGDYILFSNLPTKDAIFFADSFNNLNRVEVNSSLLNLEQCEVNQVEGIVTLPIDREAQETININETPVINSNSNGRSGNNEQANAQLHGSIRDILDNNADTWFEYERVVASDDGVALVLDFTINLGQEHVINFVRVNPNNFGARTQVEILAIDTSIDGQDFVSIKDDIPISGFIAEDEANVFTLAPSTSKFAGQGLYSFTARKARYVHLTLRQSTPYTITTSTGVEKSRYAIGIRDVHIEAIPYQAEGEIVSTNYELNDEVRKVAVIASQRPDASTVSQLVAIDHSISPDNGVTWYQVRPRNSDGQANTVQDIPELLDFNGVGSDSINTNNPVRSLRYRAKLTRNTNAFVSDSDELAQVIASKTELHIPPTTTPLVLNLQNNPITGTLRLIDPQFGSRGKVNNKYQIATGNGSRLRILLPFKPLVRDFQKVLNGSIWTLEDVDPQTVYINGIPWTRGDPSVSDNYYQLNFEEGRLDFGAGSNTKVPTGASISMTLSEERLFPSRGTGHVAQLNYPTSNDKEQVELFILHPAQAVTKILKRGTKRHQLEPDIVGSVGNSSLSISPAPGGVEQAFVDGDSELAANQYSIDYTNGVLYLGTATDTSTETIVNYQYNPRTKLNNSDWQFVDSNSGIANAISISDNSFRTFTKTAYAVPSGVNYFNLSTLAVVRGSLNFTGNTSGILDTEVNYIDGRSELLGVVYTVEELDPITGITAGVPINIPFKMKISTDTSLTVSFTNTDIFVNSVGSDVDVDTGNTGDYYVNRAGGYIRIKLAGDVEDPGTVDYYYINPQVNLTGRYSVNYQTGEVFCYTETGAGIYVTHEYTDFRVRYNIARLIPSSDWEFDSSTKKLTINDREILKNLNIPQGAGNVGSNTRYYQAVYQYVKATRANVSELEPFFTPVLKDYALKVITKSRLV